MLKKILSRCALFSALLQGTCNCFPPARLLVSRCSELSEISDHDKADASMTPSSSKEALGRSSKHLFDPEEEPLRRTQLVRCNEASYRPSRTPSNAGGGAPGTHTVLRTAVRQEPSKIEELNRDSFLRFRNEWVRTRAREIQRAGSISFKTCSEDTASITALNEFYMSRAFEGFMAEHGVEEELEIAMLQGSCEFGRFPKDAPASEKLQMRRIFCREKGRRVFNTTCRRRAMSRA